MRGGEGSGGDLHQLGVGPSHASPASQCNRAGRPGSDHRPLDLQRALVTIWLWLPCAAGSCDATVGACVRACVRARA